MTAQRHNSNTMPDSSTSSSDFSPYSFKALVNFMNNNFALIFLFALIFVGGFIIGSLWTEKQMLKNGTNTGAIVKDADPTVVDEGPTQETLAQVPKVDKNDHIRGNANAKLTFIEYSDYQCPYCSRFHPTMKQVLDEYGDKVAWVYRHYPLSFHENAQKLGEMGECVAKLGGNEKFWQFSDLFYSGYAEDETLAQIDNALKLVAQIGLNQTAVKSCMDSGEMTKKVTDQMAGGTKAGVSGTPGTIVVTKDGKYELIPGALPFEQVKAIVEKYL